MIFVFASLRTEIDFEDFHASLNRPANLAPAINNDPSLLIAARSFA